MTLRLIHLANVEQGGGVTRLVSQFPSVLPQHRHELVCTNARPPASFRRQLTERYDKVSALKYWRGLRIPRSPQLLRTHHLRNLTKLPDAALALIWGSSSQHLPLFQAGLELPFVHYEHGSIWEQRDTAAMADYLQHARHIVACSKACQRMIQLRWAPETPVSVCTNPLSIARPDETKRRSRFRSDRPKSHLTLGWLGRIVLRKGVFLAIEAVHKLRQSGYDVRFKIGGTGPAEGFLGQQIRRLGLVNEVQLLGPVSDLSEFFSDVDVFIYPSLYEAFGLSCLEAAAFGIPSIVTDVDGLPEAVRHGETGVCIAPTLETAATEGLLGSIPRVPEFVYDPSTDALRAPKWPAPDALANAIAALLDDSTGYQAMATRCAQQFDERFSMEHYAAQMSRLVEGIIR